VGILDDPLLPPLDVDLMAGVSAVFRRCFLGVTTEDD
jgi:hypothetical protein